MISFTCNAVDGFTIERYRDRHHVIVIGLLEQGALFNWAYIWGDKRGSGRWPKKRPSQPDADTKARTSAVNADADG